MITAEIVKAQMEKEVDGTETPAQQAERLEIDLPGITDFLTSACVSLSQQACIVGGICIGLECAGIHSSARSLDNE